MTEQTPQDLLNAMNALLQKATTTTTPTSATGWTQPQQQTPAALVQGVAVPVKISRGRGNLKILLWLPAECASSPSALNAALDQLESAGIPLDIWEPKDSGGGGWGSGSGYGNRGGWRR
ncbi:MAG: hypothetical protein P9F19_01545 [Candidatus Contendobacter sp.]|nr:hypothetical protein [Candidatus Contendobacter sp.]MDG4556074.1 hypothetical protein [Candidatus Contendobacter sp.]